MYWEFKEIKETVSDKYKRSFNSVSSGVSNDQLSVGSYHNEDKPISKEEHLFSTIKPERRKLVESMSPEPILGLNKKTISQMTNEESVLRMFKNTKSNEFSESITLFNYGSIWFQFFTTITYEKQRQVT